MEDVIFAGTRERKPVGMAAVTMTLVDPSADTAHDAIHHAADGDGASNGANGLSTNGSSSNGSANGEAHGPTNGLNGRSKPAEVTITRRLFRSGESEYLVDGKTARLRDIQELFMGTGLGPESYAIIEQGRIGQILSSRPQDRRSVIEEAAGITKFKTKRRLAEAKLEGARQNLARVFDILEEVGRQANSLKRQASKAKRYTELRAEMIEQLRLALTGRYLVLDREASKTAIDLSLAAGEVQRLGNELAEKESEQNECTQNAYRNEAELTEARRVLEDLRIDAERTRGRLQNQAQQISTIEHRLAQGEAETENLERRSAEVSAESQRHAAEVAALVDAAESARKSVAEKNQERELLQSQLRQREQAMEESRRQVLRLLGEASTLRNQLAQIEEYLASMEREGARARNEEQTATADLERFTQAREALSAQIASRQMELDSICTQKKYVEQELADRRERLAAVRQELDQLKTDGSRLRARRDSLEEILSHRAYTTESVKRLFTAIDQGQGGDLKPLGVLADFVDVDPVYEKAAEEFLHDELEYVVVENWSQAELGIDLLRSDLDGRATFLVHPEPSASASTAVPRAAEPEIGDQTGVIARLTDVLRLTNGLTQAPAGLIPRLARCFLVGDRASAQRLSTQFPDLFFLVTDGVCYHGHLASGGRKTGSGPLALKRELRELKAQVAAHQTRIDHAAAMVERLDEEIGRLTEELERLRTLEQQEEKQTVALDHEMRKLGEEIQRANSRLSVVRLELQRLARESERTRIQYDQNKQSLEQAERAREAEESALALARSEFEDLQSRFTHATEAHAAMRVEFASLEERRRSAEVTQSRLESESRELARRKDEISGEMERLGIERARLLADNIQLDSRAAALAGQIGEAEARAGELEQREQQLRAALTAVDELLKQMRAAHQETQNRRSQIELELVKKQAELKYMDETSRKELNAGLSELTAGQETVPDELAVAEAEQKYQEIKTRIDALGPVNPSALEEYQETQQRYDFLNAQRQDLLDSIRDTEKAIQDIDVESRKRFAEAFEAINGYFRETFKTLFGGGTGEMRLSDETNAAESGIEIVASPPGKRLQNVLLLSGGEKSLTAMALLMAIFRYQPSPFCILDEVDAPLDEPNIERLMRLLKDMSPQTQFIVITHAKRTMEAAQAMYGVTMQEPGVSKLVSVKFLPIAGETTAAVAAQ
jgi:chromosome segregation protein